MEIQESVLRNIHAILGWPAAPRYADVRGELTEQLMELAGPESDWNWDGALTLVVNEATRIDLALTPTELIIATEAPTMELGDLPARVATLLLERMHIEAVRLIGAGSVWLAPVAAIDELNSWLASQLGTLGKPGVYDAFGGKPSAFTLKAKVEGDELSYDVELKPITASEAAAADDFMSDEEGDFPPAALYLEVARSQFGEIPAGEAPRIFADNLKKAMNAAQTFDMTIRAAL